MSVTRNILDMEEIGSLLRGLKQAQFIVSDVGLNYNDVYKVKLYCWFNMHLYLQAQITSVNLYSSYK